MCRSPDLAFRVAVFAVAFSLASVAFAASTPAKPRFGIGKPATQQEIAAWDIDVRPDGTGLPPGRGSVAQGQSIYDDKCASCHGTFGESNDYMAIAGGVGTLGSDQPIRTTGSKLNFATTLWDYINRAMPFQSPKTLAVDEVYALTAYVLHLNDILPADATLDRDALIALKLPNRDGMTTAHGFMRRDGKPDTSNVACMRDCAQAGKLSSEMPDHARDSHGDLAAQVRGVGPADGAAVRTVAPKAMPATTDALDLAKSSGCTACHGVANRIVGPAFREIGGRYANDANAESRLLAKMKQGGGGTWGKVPMPPQPQLKDAEAKALVRWILAGAEQR
jgi:cytochrome c